MEQSAYLDMAAVEERHWWFAARRRILTAIIERFCLTPGASVLELGSGTGGNLAMLSHFGKVTAIEMDAMAREICLTRYPGMDVRPGILPNKLPLDEKYFDLICLFDVLEHIEDDINTLRTVKKLLVPGGRAILTVPAHQSLFGPHDISHHHKRRYGKDELLEKLRRSGFSIKKISYMNCALFPVALSIRFLDRIFARNTPTGSGMPSTSINYVLSGIFGVEALLLPYTNLPFGLSILAVVE